MNTALRLARAEAQVLAAQLILEREKSIQDYNIMMGNIEDPSEEDEDE